MVGMGIKEERKINKNWIKRLQNTEEEFRKMKIQIEETEKDDEIVSRHNELRKEIKLPQKLKSR